MKKNLRKNFIWNIIGTSFSAFNSLFFMIIVTRINGVDKAGVFTFAFSTACLFYVIGIYSGRTFQITDNSKEISDSDYFYSKFFTAFIMFIVSLLFCLINNYNIYKSIIILELVFYKLLEAISESSFAILQKKDELYKVGISLFLKAITSLILFFIIDYSTKNLLIASSAIIICNLIFILFYDLPNLKNGNFKLDKINYSKVGKLLKKGFFAFGFTFLTLYVINAPKYPIDYLLSNKFQTIFGIVAMPATVLILFGQYIIQPFLTLLKEKLENKISDFAKLTLKISGVLLALGLLCTFIAYFIGIPLLELMYGIKLNKYLIDLIVILLGATFYAVSVVFSTSLTTMRNTFDQFIIFVITTVFTTILSYLLVSNYQVFGACLSYMISMLFLLILYEIEFFIKINKYRRKKNG